MASRIGKFLVQTSRRTGQRYYTDPTTGLSVWHDDRLPDGWGWGKEGDAAPKFFVNLHTGERQVAAPTTPAQPPSVAGADAVSHAAGGGGDGRTAVAAASAGSEAGTTAAPGPPASSALPVGVLRPGWTLPAMPRIVESDGRTLLPQCRLGYVDEQPRGLRVDVDRSYFREPHALVLRQLLRAVMGMYEATRAARIRYLLGSGVSREDAEGEAAGDVPILLDLGAGSGGATEAMLRDGPADAQVYSADLWDVGRTYYGAQLEALGHEDRAKAWAQRADAATAALESAAGGGASAAGAAGGSGVEDGVPVSEAAEGGEGDAPAPAGPLFSQFCANFWEQQERVVPACYTASYTVIQLAHNSVWPALVWLDADLSQKEVEHTLNIIWERLFEPVIRGDPGVAQRPPLLAGGGWDLSDGVRRAVTDFAHKHALALHVEQGAAWTINRDRIKETRNDATALPAVPTVSAADVAALHVRTDAERRSAALKLWQGAVVDVLDAQQSRWEEDGGREAEAAAAAAAAGAGSAGGTKPGMKRGRADLEPAGAPAGGAALAGAGHATPWEKQFWAALADAVGAHGNMKPTGWAAAVAEADGSSSSGAGSAGGASSGASGGAAATSSDPFAGEPWIDASLADKRNLTLLMRAAKGGFTPGVVALVDRHGAGVNVQADRSLFTALILAAYRGHAGTVRTLLERGADPTLVNKFGETAAVAARKQRHAALADSLDAAAAEWGRNAAARAAAAPADIAAPAGAPGGTEGGGAGPA